MGNTKGRLAEGGGGSLEGGESPGVKNASKGGNDAGGKSGRVGPEKGIPDLLVPPATGCQSFVESAGRFCPEISLQSVWLVSRKDFLRLARFPRFEELAKRRRHVRASKIAPAPGGGSGDPGDPGGLRPEEGLPHPEASSVLFVAHEWVAVPPQEQQQQQEEEEEEEELQRANHHHQHHRLWPDDPGNTQYRHVERFLTETPQGRGITHIYIDCSSVPGGPSGSAEEDCDCSDGSRRRAEINTMTAISLCTYVLCVPATVQADSGLVVSDVTGFTRDLSCQRDCAFALLMGRPLYLALRMGLKALYVQIQSPPPPTLDTGRCESTTWQRKNHHYYHFGGRNGDQVPPRDDEPAGNETTQLQRAEDMDAAFPNFCVASQSALSALHRSLRIPSSSADAFFRVEEDPWELAILALANVRCMFPLKDVPPAPPAAAASAAAHTPARPPSTDANSHHHLRTLSTLSRPRSNQSSTLGYWPGSGALRPSLAWEGLRTMTAGRGALTQLAEDVMNFVSQMGGDASLSDASVALEVIFVAGAVSGLLTSWAGDKELADLGLDNVDVDDEDGALRIMRMGLTACGLPALARKVVDPSMVSRLSEIHLAGNFTAGNGLGWLMRRAPLLWRVVVLEDRMPRDQILELGSAMGAAAALADLTLSSVGLSDDSIGAICSGLKSCPLLERLALPGNRFGDNGLIWLGRALRSVTCSSSSPLTKLVLSNNDIGGSLDLFVCALDPDGPEEDGKGGAVLPKNSSAASNSSSGALSLTDLDLSECSLTDDGVISLGAALKSYLCNVVKLNLSSNLLAEAGVAALASSVTGVADGKGGLTHLNLSSNSVCDGGVDALASHMVHKRCTLRTLLLESVEMGDLGASMLSMALQGDPRPPIDRLVLRGNYLSAAVCSSISAAWLASHKNLDLSGQLDDQLGPLNFEAEEWEAEGKDEGPSDDSHSVSMNPDDEQLGERERTS